MFFKKFVWLKFRGTQLFLLKKFISSHFLFNMKVLVNIVGIFDTINRIRHQKGFRINNFDNYRHTVRKYLNDERNNIVSIVIL